MHTNLPDWQRSYTASQTSWERHPNGYPCSYDPRLERCWHTDCGIAAGLLPAILEFNQQFADQLHYNWLRFGLHRPEIRAARARLFWALRAHLRKTGEFAILACVYSGVGA